MSSSGFKYSSRFVQAADIVNTLPVEKFPLLLGRILAKLHLKDERLFSEEEELQLKTLFGLNDENLKLVLDGCCYIFEQSAFQGLAPEPLFEVLKQAGFDSPHAKVIGRLWATERVEFVNKLKQRTLGSTSVIGVDYHLNVTVGDSSLSKLQEPTALFEFSMLNNSKESKSEKMCVEFSHTELYSFFQQLERVQQQLDGLGGSEAIGGAA